MTLATIVGPPTLDDGSFEEIRDLVYRTSGISLSEDKRELVRSRLTRRLRALGLSDFVEYCEALRRDRRGTERDAMIDLITTNKTDFFRERSHFDLLSTRLLPSFRNRHEPVRIWSAACSTGEEPYTLAMVAMEAGFREGRVKILASDIADSVLQSTGHGVYAEDRFGETSSDLVKRYFERVSGSPGMLQARPAVRRLITVAKINLMGKFPMRNPIDVVFCRNVMIYFDPPTRHRLIDRLVGVMPAGGHLFIGHSESLVAAKHGLTAVAPGAYRKG